MAQKYMRNRQKYTRNTPEIHQTMSSTFEMASIAHTKAPNIVTALAETSLRSTSKNCIDDFGHPCILGERRKLMAGVLEPRHRRIAALASQVSSMTGQLPRNPLQQLLLGFASGFAGSKQGYQTVCGLGLGTAHYWERTPRIGWHHQLRWPERARMKKYGVEPLRAQSRTAERSGS